MEKFPFETVAANKKNNRVNLAETNRHELALVFSNLSKPGKDKKSIFGLFILGAKTLEMNG